MATPPGPGATYGRGDDAAVPVSDRARDRRGLVLDARRELQNTADAAARAGATQVHVGAYRASGGEQVVLDRGLARQVVVEYVGGHGVQLNQLDIGAERVTVGVSREVSLSFLRVVGFDAVRIQATAPAEVRYGIEQAGP